MISLCVCIVTLVHCYSVPVTSEEEEKDRVKLEKKVEEEKKVRKLDACVKNEA